MSDFVFPVPVPKPQQFSLKANWGVQIVCQGCGKDHEVDDLDEAVKWADQHEQERHADLSAMSA